MPASIQLTLDGSVSVAIRRPADNNEVYLKNKYLLEIPLDLGRNEDLCVSCGAKHFIWERVKEDLLKPSASYRTCCQRGRITLPMNPLGNSQLDIFLKDMFFSDSMPARQFRENARTYNNALAFTSLGTQVNNVNSRSRGVYCFRISGEMRHLIGPLIPNSIEAARFAQIFVVGDGAEGEVRMCQATGSPNLNSTTLHRWQTFLQAHNPYAQLFKMAKNISIQNPDARLAIRSLEDSQMGARTYNRPTVNEVSVVIGSNLQDLPPRHLILHMREGGIKRTTDLHSGYLSMRYPILFPYGEQQWHPNVPNPRSVRGECLSQLEWFAYLLFERASTTNLILRAKRLFQEFVVDLYICVERNRLNFIRRSQAELKVAQYRGVIESLGNETDIQGRKIILPSTFIGGPRAMIQLYQDAMALVKEFGRPSLFITMTGNPEWPEIKTSLEPGQIPSDRPDLIATVFCLKLNSLIEDLTKNKRLGTVVSYVYTVEFQKRGMPHAHIILILDHDSTPVTPDQIDSIVSANIPDPITEPLLHQLVTRSMLHGPCREGYRCWTPHGCQYHYPKPFTQFTSLQTGEFPAYRRPDDGRSFIKGGHSYTNRDIVPYNKYLLLRFQCHINVEIPVNLKAVKYLYKYICKGEDRSQLDIVVNDETKAFVDGRYVGPSEAAWRLFQYPLSERSPAIVRLALHLEDEQMICYTNDVGIVQQVTSGRAGRTTLTEYFALNAKNAIGRGIRVRNLLYQDVPKYFRWDAGEKTWLARVQKTSAIGRIFFARTTEGERYFLRLILLHRTGATSYNDVKTVRGILYQTFRSAAEAMGLLQNDEDYNLCINEATTFMTGAALRQMFVTILTMNSPANPQELFLRHQASLSDDCDFKLRDQYGMNNPTEIDIFDFSLFLIEELLRLEGKDLEDVGLARSNRDIDRFKRLDEGAHRNENPIFHPYSTDRYATLTRPQANIFDHILKGLDSVTQTLAYLDGPGGSGKTYLLNVILSYCKFMQIKSMAVSSSGISALLLQDGRTAHSALAIPIVCSENSTCRILPSESKYTDLLTLHFLIWDEVSMQNRYAIEAVDRTLRDLRKDQRPFGGISVLFSGDFRQTLPVIRRGTIYDQARSSLKHSIIWALLDKFSLTTNLRLNLNQDQISVEDKENNFAFSKWLLKVGQGEQQINDIEKIPILYATTQVNLNLEILQDSLIDWVYKDLANLSAQPSGSTLCDYYADRSIITPLNKDVIDLNDKILIQIQGRSMISTSVDQVTEDSPQSVGEEILNNMNIPGFPSHKIKLKEKMTIVILRNMNIGAGLCNGTRLLLEKMKSHVFMCTILSGIQAGKKVLIPKITLTYEDDNDFGVSFRRYQFPVAPAFAMTINKSQGQGFTRVGVFLANPVFAHGQLYVALSRSKQLKDLKVAIVDNDSGNKTYNVVCRDILK